MTAQWRGPDGRWHTLSNTVHSFEVRLATPESPKEAVLKRLAQAHDRFSELEQLYRVEGNVVEAEGAHQYALITLRAYRAEMDDPDPKDWWRMVTT